MQNRYVGDVGDFGKFGLLRFLSGETAQDDLERLRLGVIWYLVPDEHHNADGRHIGFLEPTESNIRRYGRCDRDLWARLGHLVGHNARCVRSVELAEILPPDTLYYGRMLCTPDAPPDVRQAVHHHWFGNAARAVRAAELVYVDPDNGIARNDNQRFRQQGPKYVYLDHLRTLWDRGQSLVIYHHIGRNAAAAEQVQEYTDFLVEGLGLERPPKRLLFRRGTARCFFVVIQERHRDAIIPRIRQLLQTPWNQHFVRV